jgi:hypothetical protein
MIFRGFKMPTCKSKFNVHNSRINFFPKFVDKIWPKWRFIKSIPGLYDSKETSLVFQDRRRSATLSS